MLFKPSHTLLDQVTTFRLKQFQEETEYLGILPRPEIGLASKHAELEIDPGVYIFFNKYFPPPFIYFLTRNYTLREINALQCKIKDFLE